jgi:hypothetical protein
VSDELKRLAAFGLAAALVFTVIVLSLPRLLGAAAGPEVEILTVLKTAEASGLELEVGGGTLVSTKAGFQRISVAVTGKEALVTATLDFDGAVGETQVSSLGAERVPFKLDGSEWVPQAGFAPRLGGIVRALQARRAALEHGEVASLCSGRADAGESSDLEALLRVGKRKLTAERWLIRSERDEVLVTEEWRLKGELPERPVDDRGSRRLKLQVDPGGEFCFPEGLM